MKQFFSGQVSLHDERSRALRFSVHGNKLYVELEGADSRPLDTVCIEVNEQRLGPFCHVEEMPCPPK